MNHHPATPSVRALAIALTVPLLALFFWMVRGVIVPVIIGGLFAIVMAPLHDRLARRLGKRGKWASALLTTATLVVILVPTAIVGVLTVQQVRGIKTSGFATSVQKLTTAGIRAAQRTGGWLSRLGVDMSTETLRASIEDGAQNLIGKVGEVAGEALTSAPDLIVGAVLFVLALYVFMREGKAVLGWLDRVLPFPASDIRRLFTIVNDAARGVIFGQLFTGAVQAGLALGFLFALQVPGAFLWGILAFVLSFIPMFGTTPVTLGASVYLFVSGRNGAGIIMLGGLVVIGAADNIVRPLVAAGRDMHPLLTLLAIFGGLATLGASGVFLGPMIAALALWVIEFYGHAKQVDASSTS